LALAQIQPSAAGVYTVAVRNLVGSVTSSNALVTVTPPAQPSLLSAVSADRHNIQLTLAGDAGVFFTIQTSSNLVDWVDLTNLLNVSGTIQFSNEVSAGSNPLFYRAKWLQQ
jgi:hypothetical protein